LLDELDGYPSKVPEFSGATPSNFRVGVVDKVFDEFLALRLRWLVLQQGGPHTSESRGCAAQQALGLFNAVTPSVVQPAREQLDEGVGRRLLKLCLAIDGCVDQECQLSPFEASSSPCAVEHGIQRRVARWRGPTGAALRHGTSRLEPLKARNFLS